jgi:hypothetical protein
MVPAFFTGVRDVEELLAERGLHADHVTVWRWVLDVTAFRPGEAASFVWWLLQFYGRIWPFSAWATA